MVKKKKIDGNEVDWINFIEIRAFGLMRSGNHAILEWIQNQYPGQSSCFLNNVVHGDHDPYTSCAKRVVVGFDDNIETELLRMTKKHLLIFSYEDRAELAFENRDFLSSFQQSNFEIHRKRYLRESNNTFNLLIIRDPFNCLASRLKMIETRGVAGGLEDLDLIAYNWKILAREAISLIRAPKPGKIVVKFNQWATNKDYRKELSRSLLGTFNDSSKRHISHFGGGSSFDGPGKLTLNVAIKRWRNIFKKVHFTKLDTYWKRLRAPSASSMKIFERWKFYTDHNRFRTVIRDSEIIELSEQLFGELPGTQEFVKSIQNNKI